MPDSNDDISGSDERFSEEEIQEIHEIRRQKHEQQTDLQQSAVKYINLKLETRSFFEGLSKTDVKILQGLLSITYETGGIDNLKSYVEMAQAISLMARWSKWLLLSVAAVITAVATITTAISKLWPNTAGNPHP